MKIKRFDEKIRKLLFLPFQYKNIVYMLQYTNKDIENNLRKLKKSFKDDVYMPRLSWMVCINYT